MLVGSVRCMVQLVRAFQFEIKALVKWSRLGEERPGKVEFLDILALPIQSSLCPSSRRCWTYWLTLRSMGTACHNAMRRLTALRRQSCLRKASSRKISVCILLQQIQFPLFILYCSSFIHTSIIRSAFFNLFVGYLRI